MPAWLPASSSAQCGRRTQIGVMSRTDGTGGVSAQLSAAASNPRSPRFSSSERYRSGSRSRASIFFELRFRCVMIKSFFALLLIGRCQSQISPAVTRWPSCALTSATSSCAEGAYTVNYVGTVVSGAYRVFDMSASTNWQSGYDYPTAGNGVWGYAGSVSSACYPGGCGDGFVLNLPVSIYVDEVIILLISGALAFAAPRGGGSSAREPGGGSHGAGIGTSAK